MSLRDRAGRLFRKDGARKPVPVEAKRPELSAFAATVLGMRGAALEEIIESVAAMSAGAGACPVFVTDLLDLRVFHRRRAAVEALPYPRDGTQSSSSRWRLYRDEECRRIGRVWGPCVVVEFGRLLEVGQAELIRRPDGPAAAGQI